MLKSFLDKYDTVIFDMDGVITSEQNYWNCAALTVWEYLNLNKGIHIDATYGMKNYGKIRKKVFCDDELISVLKGKGVNSNWDLGYMIVLISWICKVDEDFEPVLEYARKLPDNIIDEYDNLAKECSDISGFDFEWLKRNGVMWQTMQSLFQEWFLGEKLWGKPSIHPGKTGLLFNEEPIVDKSKLHILLKELSESKRLCTGTGRPLVEMMRPLEDWEIKNYFAVNGLCNYDHVVAAEKELNNNALTKPHPYMFLKALYGTDYDNAKILDGDYDKSKISKTLIVGDAGSDILAAKAMGADFCAVLTGVSGQAARGYFEKMKAEYILDDVCSMLEE